MALVKISELPEVATFTGEELRPVVQNGSTKKSGQAFNGVHYAPLPTGNAATDRANINTAIEECIVGSDITQVRSVTRSLVLGPGIYFVNGDLNILSTQGFHLSGAGPSLTFIRAVGITTQVLNINGSADGLFENFTIMGDGTEDLLAGIRLDYTAAVGRSSTNNVFRNITVRNLKYRSGIAVGELSSNRQVDATSFYNCVVTGNYTKGSGSSTLYQHGFLLGSGTAGNIIGTQLYNSTSTLNRWGVYGWATDFHVTGSQPAGNEVDFYINGVPTGPISIANVRTESSHRFLQNNPGQTALSSITISDVQFVNNDHVEDDRVIDVVTSTLMTIRNFTVTLNAAPKFRIIGYAGNKNTVLMENVATQSTLTDLMETADGQSVVVISYVQLDADNVTVNNRSEMVFLRDGVVATLNDTIISRALMPTGAKAETLPRSFTADEVSLTSGRLQLVAVTLPANTTLTSISFVSRVTGAVTPTNWWFGLFSNAVSPDKLAVTADQTTTAWGAFEKKTVVLTTPFVTTYSGLYYLGICMVAATPISLLSAPSPGPETGTPYLHGSSTTGLTTPASCPATVATPVALTLVPWAYVS